VTFGRFSTVNGPFFRKRIEGMMEVKPTAPYVVLSIQELDAVIRLAERGKSLDEVLSKLASNDTFNVLYQYQSELAKEAVSTFSGRRGKAFLDGIGTA
jgi:hypothetical protein